MVKEMFLVPKLLATSFTQPKKASEMMQSGGWPSWPMIFDMRERRGASRLHEAWKIVEIRGRGNFSVCSMLGGRPC